MEMTSSISNYDPKQNKDDPNQFEDVSLLSTEIDSGKIENEPPETLMSSRNSCQVKSIIIDHPPLNE
jgi:hypothetical protein